MIYVKYITSFILGNHIFFLLNYYLRYLFFGRYIVIVTYHDTPPKHRTQFEQQLIFFSKYYSDCTKSDLSLFLETGIWEKTKPGIIITFDDGLKSNYTIAKPLLEKFGFSGWFMIPAQVLELNEKSQRVYVSDSKIDVEPCEAGTSVFMSPSDLRSLIETGHEVVCHSYSHARLSPELTPEVLDVEIRYSKERLEGTINREVDCFAWVGGEDYAYSSAAFNKIKESGYKLVFATNCRVVTPQTQRFNIERFHIDPHYTMFQLCFAISWAYGLGYYFKRRRIRQKIFGS